MIAAAFVGGCGGCTDEAEKQLLQNKPAHISGSDAAILDFEDYTKWGNAAANSSTASHGAHSAVINVNNWTEVTSVSISNLGQTIGDVASVDVMVPYSPMSWGEVKLIVKLPSLGEWYRELGTVSLAGKSAGTFYPASFQIPSDLRQKLKGTYSDLVFTVVINGPSGTYLLDNLAMGLVVDGDTEADTDTSTPPPTANIVSIPNSAEISNVVAAVNAEFTLLERANISGAAQLITCNGDSGGTIGMDATATSIMSVGSMGLAPRSQVNGDVVCAASVNVDATASVSGQVAQNQTFSAPREISLNLSLPWPTSSDRILAPWQTDSVAPGTYNSLIAYQGANATLSSGIYRVKSLQVEPQAVLKIDDSNGPVIVLISDSFAYSGSVVSQSAGDPQLFVGFAGSLVELYSAFKGTLFAPNATVNMAGLPAGEHQGSVFANQLKLHPDARLSYRAFSGWSDLCGSILTGDCNSAGCPPDYVMEDGTCINSKSVNCADAAPENATAEIAQVEITYTDAGGWTNPADCEWNCNTDFDLVNSACISTQLVDCTDAAPQNAISTISQVAINYTTAEGWETPAECEWACNTDYDQAGDTCINTQTVDCTDVAPANATSTVVPIQITYTSAGGWTVPSVCAWSCNTDYAQSGNSCINSQLVDCTDVAPANGTSTIAQVQINYTTPGGWTTPADCAWTCDASYHTEDSTTCVSDTQSVNCTDNAPTNGTSTVVPVEITWTGSGWTTSADCAWSCDVTYHTEDSTTCVSDTQSVNCTDNAPTNGTSTVVPVEITWTGSGWTIPADCAWSCDATYHTEDSTTCVSDTQSVDCVDAAPSNGTSTIAQVEITWTGSGWTTPADCAWNCNASYHTEDSITCVSDTQMVNCVDAAPANATSTIAQVEITWTGSGWTTPADCVWSCNASYHTEDNATCVNDTQMVNCVDAAPSNGTSTIAQVEITWTGSGWTTPADCVWSCNASYHTEDNATCVSDTQMVDCVDAAPANATSTIAQVEITWTGSGWTTPEDCAWICDASYHTEDNATCVSDTQSVDCVDAAPANATSTVAQVEIMWTGSGWTTPADCAWTCDASYHTEDNATCVSDTQSVDCTDNAPTNGTSTVVPVEITWTGSGWTTPADCAWNCNASYHTEDNITCVSDTQMVDCVDVAPANATSTIAQVEITWTGSGWTTPADCAWTCDASYHTEDKITCVSDTQSVDCTDNAPANGTSTVAPVEIKWTGSSWTTPADCTWSCDTSYHTEDNATCVSDTQMVNCVDAAPANGTSTVALVEITWTGSSWTIPADCAWSCDSGYLEEGGACINSKWVDCQDTAPENATSQIVQVEIFYTEGIGWSVANDCTWSCDADYILEEGACINSKLTFCNDNPPQNAISTISEVFIFYSDGGGWTDPIDCAWRCLSDFAEENGECINSKLVDCTDNAPPNATSATESVEITYNSIDGWSVPTDCDWSCDTGYTQGDELCYGGVITLEDGCGGGVVEQFTAFECNDADNCATWVEVEGRTATLADCKTYEYPYLNSDVDYGCLQCASGSRCVNHSGMPSCDAMPDAYADDATPLPDGQVISFSDANSFIFDDPDGNPVQTGVEPADIDEDRMSILRGYVVDKGDNLPLGDVNITIHTHPEFGSTVSRPVGSTEEGWFDMAVNGGGTLIVHYEKEGYLPVQRRVSVGWNKYVAVPSVAMTRIAAPTLVNLDHSTLQNVVRGEVIDDQRGHRSGKLIIPRNTIAAVMMKDGTDRPLDQVGDGSGNLNISITEYTAGENWIESMPGALPPTTAYTYAVELGADEALAMNAKTVKFNKPMYYYVENFIQLPVGRGEPREYTVVPHGYYDYEKGAWVPAENGFVFEYIDDDDDGKALIDIDGDRIPEDEAFLKDTLVFSDEELFTIAQDYQSTAERGGTPADFSSLTTLWRVPIWHFSPHDLNTPFWVKLPESPNPVEPAAADASPSRCENTESGSILYCTDQSVAEHISIPGTNETLVYRSNCVKGRKDKRTLIISLLSERMYNRMTEKTGSAGGETFTYYENVDTNGLELFQLNRLDLQIEIEGRKYRWGACCAPADFNVASCVNEVESCHAPIMIEDLVGNPTTPPMKQLVFDEWDGKDTYGRQVTNEVKAKVELKYSLKATAYTGLGILDEETAVINGDGAGGEIIPNSGPVLNSTPNNLSTISYRPRDGYVFGGYTKCPCVQMPLELTMQEAVRAEPYAVSYEVPIGGPVVESKKLGGLQLKEHHFYDHQSGKLYKGDGSIEEADAMGYRVDTFVSFQNNGWVNVAVDASGNVYVKDVNSISKYSPDGALVRKSVWPNYTFSWTYSPWGGNQSWSKIKIGPDDNLYFGVRLQDGSYGILRVDTQLSVENSELIAGGGSIVEHVPNYANPAIEGNISGENAKDVSFTYYIDTIAVAPNGEIFFSGRHDTPNMGTDNNFVRKIKADGSLEEVYHFGRSYVLGMDVSSDGTLYVLAGGGNNEYAYHLNRIPPDDTGFEQMLNGWLHNDFHDGRHYSEANLSVAVRDVAVDRQGDIYILSYSQSWEGAYQSNVRVIDNSGIIDTIAGTGNNGYYPSQDGGPATKADLYSPNSIAVGPDGTVYIAQHQTPWVIRKLSREYKNWSASASDVAVPSSDGSEVYGFNSVGQHLYTRDAVTGKLIRRFEYDSSSYLSGVCETEDDSVCTEITRSDDQVTIQPHHANATHILLDTNSYVDQVATPAGRVHDFALDDLGLMTAYRSPNEVTANVPFGESTRFEYNAKGRLTAEIKGANNKTQTFEELVLGPVQNANGTPGIMQNVLYTSSEGEEKFLSSHSTTADPVWNTSGSVWSVTRADGTSSKVFMDGKGEFSFAEQADGTLIKTRNTEDPRFKDRVQYTSRYEVILPSNVPANPADIVSGNYTPNYLSTTSRNVTLANENDLSSLLQYSEATTVNGTATSTNTYDATLNQWTYASAVPARATRTRLDEKKRMSAMLWPDAVDSDDVQLAPTYYGYDETLNQMNRITHGARETTYAFDANGRVGSMTDAEGRVHYYDYDADGLLIRELTEANSIIVKDVQYGYDANGNMNSVTPAGMSVDHELTYNDFDMMASYTPVSDDTYTTDYQYTWDRNKKYVYTKDGTITYNYERDGNSGAASAGKLLSTQLGASGNVITQSYNSQTAQLESLTYDVNLGFAWNGSYKTDEIVDLTPVSPGNAVTLHTDYSSFLRLSRETLSNTADSSSVSIDYMYENDGSLIASGDVSLTRDDKTGLLLSTELGTIRSDIRYNEYGELDEEIYSLGDGTLIGFDYSGDDIARDNMGRIVRKTESLAGATVTYAYTYDDVDRLSDVMVYENDNMNPSTWYEYEYDNGSIPVGNGNRTGLTVHTDDDVDGVWDSETVTNGTYDLQDRVQSYGTATYEFTDGGMLASKIDGADVTEFYYDLLGNLKGVDLPDGTQVEYLIDGMGRRIWKYADGVPVKGFIYKDSMRDRLSGPF